MSSGPFGLKISRTDLARASATGLCRAGPGAPPGHREVLAEARDAAGTTAEQIEAVLTAFALIQHQHHDTELPVALLHRGEHVARARRQLQALVSDLFAAGAQTGDIRADIDPGELAGYCLHALTAAANLPSGVAVRRLLDVTMIGLRSPG